MQLVRSYLKVVCSLQYLDLVKRHVLRCMNVFTDAQIREKNRMCKGVCVRLLTLLEHRVKDGHCY